MKKNISFKKNVKKKLQIVYFRIFLHYFSIKQREK